MIDEFAQLLSRWLQADGAIANQDRSLFSYAAYSLLFGTLPIMIAVLLGVLTDMLQEALLMILPFVLIRKFSGGFHLNSPIRCVVFSTAVLIAAFAAMSYFLTVGHLQLLTVLTISSAVIVIYCSPIENSARKLTYAEKRLFRKIAQILALTTLGIFVFLRLYILDEYSVPLGIGLILSASLQLPCIMIRKRR